MSETTPEVGPMVKVARDLSAIIDMTPQLDEQAEAKANATMDGHNLPGGLAMVALAPVANIEAWEHQYEAARPRRGDRIGTDGPDAYAALDRRICATRDACLKRADAAQKGNRPEERVA